MRRHRLGTALAFKQGACLFLDFLLPLPNLDWVSPVLLTDLVDRLHSAYGFQTNLGLELRAVILPRLRFSHYALPLMTVSSLNHCLENRDHYTEHRVGFSSLFTRLFMGSLALRPALLLFGNSQPRVTTKLLPHATGAYGQLPRRDFNPLNLLLLLRTVRLD
jgi:hypothetical protein